MPEPQRALRLVFEYDGEDVRLISQHEVTMVVSGAEEIPERFPGYYIDARDAEQRTLARVAAPNAFARSLEVFPEHEDESIRRVDLDQLKGAFTVVVPAPERAAHVAMVRVEPAPDDGSEPPDGTRPMHAVDIATFPLRLDR